MVRGPFLTYFQLQADARTSRSVRVQSNPYTPGIQKAAVQTVMIMKLCAPGQNVPNIWAYWIYKAGPQGPDRLLQSATAKADKCSPHYSVTYTAGTVKVVTVTLCAPYPLPHIGAPWYTRHKSAWPLSANPRTLLALPPHPQTSSRDSRHCFCSTVVVTQWAAT